MASSRSFPRYAVGSAVGTAAAPGVPTVVLGTAQGTARLRCSSLRSDFRRVHPDDLLGEKDAVRARFRFAPHRDEILEDDVPAVDDCDGSDGAKPDAGARVVEPTAERHEFDPVLRLRLDCRRYGSAAGRSVDVLD